MKKIWFFGCSHGTSDFNLTSHNQCWTSLLATSLHMEEINCCVSGFSNDDIVESIIDNRTKISADDVVVVLMTFPHRFVHNGSTILPSDSEHSQYYKIIHADDFYRNKMLQSLLSIKYLLLDQKYIISCVDPSVILNDISRPCIKELINDKNFKFLPKLTLSLSFYLGEDRKHLGIEGHRQLSEFFINLLCESM